MTGEAFNCYDRYVSDWDVGPSRAGTLRQQQPSRGTTDVPGTKSSPRKSSLGMTFGGDQRLRETIGQLVDAVRR